jgi:uncharacterized membrane protein HdeD (DUF308 family)
MAQHHPARVVPVPAAGQTMAAKWRGAAAPDHEEAHMAAEPAGPAEPGGPPGRMPPGGPTRDGGTAEYRTDETAGYAARRPGPSWALSSAWGQAWQVIMVAAVLTFVLGLILLVWPKATLNVVAILIGLALIVTGIFRLISGFTVDEASGGTRAAYIIIGLLAALAGLYCLRHISVTVVLLAFIVGVFWTLHGLVELIVAATAGPGQGRGLRALLGVLSLAAGLIVVFWPTISLTILLAVIGIWLIFYGLILAVMAWQVRSLGRSAGII